MNSQEFKRLLSSPIVELDNMLKYDLSRLEIDSSWSSINDAAQHVSFLRDQLVELSKAISDKK